MPIAFSKLKSLNHGKDITTGIVDVQPEEAVEIGPMPPIQQWITNQQYMLPIEAFSGVPMDIEKKEIRGARKMLPKISLDEASVKNANEGYMLFVDHGLLVHTPDGNPEYSRIFEEDTIGTSPLARKYVAINEKFVKTFGIREVWKKKESSNSFPVEFVVEGKWAGILMPCTGTFVNMETVSTAENVVKKLFSGVLGEFAEKESNLNVDTISFQAEIARLKEDRDALKTMAQEHYNRILEKEQEINTLKAELEQAKVVRVTNVSEQIARTWPKPMFPNLDGPTMESVPNPNTLEQMNSISIVCEHLKKTMPADREVFIAYYVNHANNIVASVIESYGTTDQTAVYPRELVRQCLKHGATGILIAHNHPSGLLRPSQADRDITRNIEAATHALDIRFLDHIILGAEDKGHFSFRENGLIK